MDLMQGALKTVDDRCNVEGLRVNPRKTALIHFTYKRRDRNIATPTIFGERLALLREVKYLGNDGLNVVGSGVVNRTLPPEKTPTQTRDI
jgi:hypothetical protein